MKPTCIFIRDWRDRPHWCICHWESCEAVGDECPDFASVISAEDYKKFCENVKR